MNGISSPGANAGTAIDTSTASIQPFAAKLAVESICFSVNQTLDLSNQGITYISPSDFVLWLYQRQSYFGGTGNINLSGNRLPTANIDALIEAAANVVHSISFGGSVFDLSGPNMGAPSGVTPTINAVVTFDFNHINLDAIIDGGAPAVAYNSSFAGGVFFDPTVNVANSYNSGSSTLIGVSDRPSAVQMASVELTNFAGVSFTPNGDGTATYVDNNPGNFPYAPIADTGGTGLTLTVNPDGTPGIFPPAIVTLVNGYGVDLIYNQP